MKFNIKVGSKVAVTKGKFYGKEAVVVSVDKKSKRIQLDGLKKSKSKKKDIHGTFHYSSLRLVTPPAEKVEEASANTAPQAQTPAPAEPENAESAKKE